MRQRTDFRRRSPELTPKQRILIVCEGEQTEPGYFNGLRRAHRLGTTEVEVVPGGEPKECLKVAEERAGHGDFDQVWCVMDVDDHAQLDATCERIGRLKRFRAAVSCPCFEVWLLLHHRYSARAVNAGDAKAEAGRKIESYDTGETYPGLEPLLQPALDNAVRLRQHHASAGSVTHPNPSTDVDELVRALRDLARPTSAATEPASP